MTKRFILIFLFFFPILFLTAQNKEYRLSGQLVTVENDTIFGYITWKGDKNSWIDFFEAQKAENTYAHYFTKNDGRCISKNNYPFASIQQGTFCCRFGNIQHIRLTELNGITLQLKNGQNMKLRKSLSSGIGYPVNIFNGKVNLLIKWEQISEINFMPVKLPVDKSPLTAGIVQSTQGIYKGLIRWNYNIPFSIEEETDLNKLILSLQGISRNKSGLEIITQNHRYQNNFFFLSQTKSISVNMPGIGSVSVPWSQFERLSIIPLEEVKLPSYADFKSPEKLQGEVLTQNGSSFKGELTYNLSASFEIETLKGKNNDLFYRIPFQYILSIEPKNFKYSFITLRNGSQLSLGDTPDVNRNNQGIIIFPSNQTPIYIPWEEIKKITFN